MGARRPPPTPDSAAPVERPRAAAARHAGNERQVRLSDFFANGTCAAPRPRPSGSGAFPRPRSECGPFQIAIGVPWSRGGALRRPPTHRPRRMRRGGDGDATGRSRGGMRRGRRRCAEGAFGTHDPPGVDAGRGPAAEGAPRHLPFHGGRPLREGQLVGGTEDDRSRRTRSCVAGLGCEARCDRRRWTSCGCAARSAVRRGRDAGRDAETAAGNAPCPSRRRQPRADRTGGDG